MTQSATSGPPPLPSAVRALRALLSWKSLTYVLIFFGPAIILAPWFGVVLERDEAAYSTLAMGLRHGLVPYRDLFDHKPPLVYGIYWFAFLFGQDVWQPRVLAALALGATGVMTVLTAREMGYGRRTSLVAGAIFALSTSNVLLRITANTEAFMLLPMTASLYALVRAENTGRTGWHAASGLLAGLAVLVKTTAAFPALALMAFLLARRRPRQREAAAFAVGAASPLLVTVALFAAFSALSDFWYANVTYNRLYTEVIPLSERLWRLFIISPSAVLGGLIFWHRAAVGLVLAARRRAPFGWLLLLWVAGAYLGIKVTGRDLSHYYAQLLPGVALAGALSVSAIAQDFRRRGVRLAVYATLVPLAIFQLALYATLASTASSREELHITSDCETEAPAVGQWIRERSQPSDRIYNLGRDSEIYFYSQRLPAARFMYDRPFELDPDTAGETAEALRREPPRFIVDTLACITVPGPPAEVAALIDLRYRLAETVGRAVIYELRTAAVSDGPTWPAGAPP